MRGSIMGIYQIIGVLLLIQIGAVSSSTECSIQNRASNWTACRERIILEFYNTDLFWFGDSYAQNCPLGFLSGMDCSNPNPLGTSLGTRLFNAPIDLDLLTHFLTVEYTSDPGQYTACGASFYHDETVMFDLDPSNASQIETPWDTRHTPQMSWNASEGELYSIYVYDAAYYITHAVYINIEGNDVPTTGENVIDKYHGPLVSSGLRIPYVFFLFKQNGRVEPQAAEEWFNATHEYGTLPNTTHIPDFITLLNMTGPIAINWLVASGDAYAAETMYNRAVLVNCPRYVGLEMDLKPRPFLPNPVSLTVQMDITFHLEEINYYTCCVNYTERTRTFTLNPIGNELLTTAATRSGLQLDFTLRKTGLYIMSTMFTGDMYTMIAMDPDVPVGNVGNESHPLLHQMQINIMNGNFSTGEVVIPWSGPTPPNNEPHYYYFLLYKHTSPVTAQQMTSYAGENCFPTIVGRCLYDINAAVSENNFTLVGANWFRAVRDPYVIYRNLLSNPNNTDSQCQGQTGYTLDCIQETSAGPGLYTQESVISLVTFCSVVLLSLLV